MRSRSEIATRWAATFSIGFRPFFLLGALFGALLILIWILFLQGMTNLPAELNPLLWHGREMLFGFLGAIIVGFVLTAAGNWTGLATTRPTQLLGLVLLWLVARLGFLFPQAIPLALTSVMDLLLFPLVALLLGRVLLASRNQRNYAFLPFFGALTLLNATSHLSLHGLIPLHWGLRSLDATVLLVTVLLVFMGGRVIPFFTGRRLPDVDVRQNVVLNWSATVTTLACAVVVLLFGRHTAAGPLLLLASLLNLIRWARWQPRKTLGDALLWVLHFGYLWICIGLALLGLHLLGAPVNWSAGSHALTVGAMGLLVIGMMARVSLGHTGRPLQAPPLAIAAFVAIIGAAVLRLLWGLMPQSQGLLAVAGIFWVLGFVLFLLAYADTLTLPRPDEDPAMQRVSKPT
ncbi:NnrS family protein [Methylonatrum kenyense]|uniref:NnrS family protein n=1 Tax=Methylonatrum kenyense TaxID=455253 RepID=UPI0020BF5BC0|nr:NnrS family protein [Methylonatrum kenyense]MCK8515807.1 NnrS family protein [Methylonatrum kenyense]